MYKIAIDGPAGAGKSTISKKVAQELKFEYIDTGSMYRAITLKAMRLGINMENEEEYSFLQNTKLNVDQGKVFLDGEDVSEAIRSIEVTNNVSTPSKIGVVRSYLVDFQRKISNSKNIIMDGRDIGTVVLPNADLKIYLDATIECRARRRMDERMLKGVSQTLEETIEEIRIRDFKDSTRTISPLKKAEDAVVIDSSDMTIDQVVKEIIKLVHERGFKSMSEKFVRGQEVQGYVINVTPSYLKIELGEDTLGIIYANDMLDFDTQHSLHDYYNVGQQFKAQVKQIDKDNKTGQPLVILSTKLAEEAAKLEAEKAKVAEFAKIKEADEIIEAKVVKVIKAGAFLAYNGVEVFMPTKQSELSEAALRKMVGQTISVLVTYVNPERMQVQVSQTLASHKLARLAKQAEYDALEVGQVIEGQVSSIMPYGAIVSFGKLSGLLHQSEIDHKIVRNVNDYLKEGQTVTAKIIKLENNKISLSIRALTPHPWEVLKEQYHVGDVFEGTVEKVIPAGLIIKLTDRYSGLMPRSEFSWLINEKLEESVHEGDTITVKVLEITDDKKRVTLSHRATIENAWGDIKLRRDDRITVVIASIEEKGAKVTYKNVTGFLPVGEASATKRIGKVDEVFPVGTEIEVAVLNCDPLRAKLLVSAKAIEVSKERASFDKYMRQQANETPVSTMGEIFGNLDLFNDKKGSKK